MLQLKDDIKAVKTTLAGQGQKLDRVVEKVAAHDQAIMTMQDLQVPS